MAQEQRRAWSGKSRGGSFGYLFFVRVIRLLGIRAAYVVLAFVALYFIPFAPKATAAIWDYNRRTRRLGWLGSAWQLYRHYYTFGLTLIDRMALRAGMQQRYRFAFEEYDRFLEIINSGSGVVMIGAHVGLWEAGASFFGKYGKHINIVMLDAEHEAIKRILEEQGITSDFKIIPINEGGLEAMIAIRKALTDGEYVCFNGDRFYEEATAIPHPLMGREAHFPSGPFRIAARCRVPVVFYYAMREKGRCYRFHFEEVPAEELRSAEAILNRYTSSLERLMARYPRQWFNFYKFWN